MNDKAKILVVDDEVPVAMVMVALLTRAGFAVEAACSMEKALQKVEMDHFDLITLDVDMPDGNGFDLFEQLRELPQMHETPVVFVSGRPEHQQRALQLGSDFIGKPFAAKEFVGRIRKHLKETVSELRKN